MTSNEQRRSSVDGARLHIGFKFKVLFNGFSSSYQRIAVDEFRRLSDYLLWIPRQKT